MIGWGIFLSDIIFCITCLEYDEHGNTTPTKTPYKSYIQVSIESKEFFIESKHNCEDISTINPFMGVVINYGEKSINIKDNFDKFLVVGHKLDHLFMKAFLHTFYNEEADDEYNITFLDNNCDMKFMNQSNTIEIKKNGYEIV